MVIVSRSQTTISAQGVIACSISFSRGRLLSLIDNALREKESSHTSMVHESFLQVLEFITHAGKTVLCRGAREDAKQPPLVISRVNCWNPRF